MAKILIADDDATMAEMLAEAFRGKGHEVAFATDADATLEEIRNNSFDLVVLDYKIPGKNGPQILSQLQLENALIPPTMVLSSQVSHGLVSECIEAGAKDFVIKPFNLPVLVQRAEKLLHRASR